MDECKRVLDGGLEATHYHYLGSSFREARSKYPEYCLLFRMHSKEKRNGGNDVCGHPRNAKIYKTGGRDAMRCGIGTKIDKHSSNHWGDRQLGKPQDTAEGRMILYQTSKSPKRHRQGVIICLMAVCKGMNEAGHDQISSPKL